MNNQMPFFIPYNIPPIMSNNNYEKMEERIENLEKKIHVLENKLRNIENKYYHSNNDYEDSEPKDMYMI